MVVDEIIMPLLVTSVLMTKMADTEEEDGAKETVYGIVEDVCNVCRI